MIEFCRGYESNKMLIEFIRSRPQLNINKIHYDWQKIEEIIKYIK